MLFLDMAAALVIGTLSGMGIGGGGLLVVYLTLIRNTAQIEAQGINLYFFIFASSAAMFVHAVRRKINYPLILLVASVGAMFAYMGAALANNCNPELVRKFFGWMLIIAGGLVLTKSLYSGSLSVKFSALWGRK